MNGDARAVRDPVAMLAGMVPVLRDGIWHFCTTVAASAAAVEAALALFREDEGVTLILDEADARRFGFATPLPMARITLEVFSALDGVGLTAAVATALAGHGIPCNMVAACHHDHVFVPHGQAEEALAVLRELQRRAGDQD